MAGPVAAMVQRQWTLDHCELLSTTTCTINKLQLTAYLCVCHVRGQTLI